MNKGKLTTFYIVRHGQTDWNAQKLVQGHTDIPLNATGETQAKEVAKKFKNIKFDLAFSSDLLRAKRTAEIIVLEHKLAVETTKLLRERHYGLLEGKPSQALITHLTLLKTLSHEERQKYRVDKSAENNEVFIARVLTFLRETAIANPGKTILVGTHGGVMYVLLEHLGAITFQESVDITIKNGGYIKLTTDGVDFFIEEVSGVDKKDKK